MLKSLCCVILTCGLAATTASASAPAPTVAAAKYEVRFMKEMVNHHAMAVMMAELCLERAVHPELIAQCHEIREMQLEEIATMQGWLEDWYGVTHEPEMTPGAERQMMMMAELEGAEFEIAFMKSMIRHHWMAVVKARQCQDRAYHEELVTVCHEIETMQLAEIELMGSWLCDWYQVCNYHGSGS